MLIGLLRHILIYIYSWELFWYFNRLCGNIRSNLIVEMSRALICHLLYRLNVVLIISYLYLWSIYLSRRYKTLLLRIILGLRILIHSSILIIIKVLLIVNWLLHIRLLYLWLTKVIIHLKSFCWLIVSVLINIVICLFLIFIKESFNICWTKLCFFIKEYWFINSILTLSSGLS
jgi:hypothetical protein